MQPEAPDFDSVFCRAVEIVSETERAAFLACAGDEKLRRRVEHLVAAHFRAGSRDNRV